MSQFKHSASADALLRAVQKIEQGLSIDLFNQGPDIEQVQRMVETYRGSLYDDLVERLDKVARLSGVLLATQRDIFSLIVQLWEDNISRLNKTELLVLQGAVEMPGESISNLSRHTGISYSRTRRGYRKTERAGVLRVEGMLNCESIGLERVIIVLQNPSLSLVGPYIEKSLYVDGAIPTVYLVATYPRDRQRDLLMLCRSMRATCDNISVFRISIGKPRFSSLYFNYTTSSWSPDLLHQRLMLRQGGEPITLGRFSEVPETYPNLRDNDLKTIDLLRRNYQCPVDEITERTGISESTAFKKRKQIQQAENPVLLPRTRLSIPALSERIMVIASPETAGDVVPAWRELPLTYMSRMDNLEDRTDNRIMLLAAVTAGSAVKLVRILKEEISRVNNYSAHIISAGTDTRMSVAAMYDNKAKSWKWEHGIFFEPVSYGVARRDADSQSIPVDLA
ncbi:hypothetical protein EU546_06605 [Candidatus Thorarchaeota archaeon]|nr:MAG: hypothetical protein EU546_06605 [Candidatus Thorarchaeota archaeon]